MTLFDKKESLEKEYPYGLRTVMEIFDIGPAVAFTVLTIVGTILIAGMVIFIRSAPPSVLTIASGPEGTSFHKTALKYAKILERNGVKVKILTSTGSVDNLNKLMDPKSRVHLAFVQDGLTNEDEKFDGLVSLGAVSYQPIMVFYRGKPVERLAELQGKTIAIGPEGSGTRKFALKLLELNEITPENPGGTTLSDMDADDAADALLEKKIDAAFVMSENAPIEDIRKLLRSDDIHLLNFKQAAAYSRKVDYLNKLELPEGAIDFGRDIPNKDISLVGPVVELLAKKNLHPALSDLILDAAMEVHGHPGMYQKRGEFPMPVAHAVKMSDDADRFYKSGKSFLYRYLPFWLASLVSRILVVFLPIAVIVIPTVRSIPAFFQWRMQMRIRRRYRELLLIEDAYKHETDPVRLAALRRSFDRIDHEVDKMKVRASFGSEFYSLRGHVDYVRGLMSHKFPEVTQ